MPIEVKVNLHPVNFIIVSGLLQCLILAGILVFSAKGNRLANRLIGIFVIICSLHFAWSLIIDLNLPDIVRQVFWFPYSYLLAIGPLLFLYTRSLSEFGFRMKWKHYTHFVPVIIEVVIQIYFIGEGIRNDRVHYVVSGFQFFRIVEFTSTAISILLYGKMSLALIRKHEAAMAENFSSQKDITLLWLSRLISYLRVLWVFWLAFELSFIVFLQFQLHYVSVYILLYILLGVITYSTYWIGLQALKRSEALMERKSLTPPPENPNVYSRLSEAEVKGYIERLTQLMQKEKLYLHETLTLRMLAMRLETDPNLVSYVLNSILHKSFYDYVNEFRVDEVKRKVNDPAFAHLKIVEVAYECGFNSKATFNRAFKKHTGKSPSEYRKPATSL